MSDLAFTLGAVSIHPIKSCAGIAVEQALLIETGLDLDRHWMLVDAAGEFVSQRELPRMALVQPALRGQEMVLRAPGMLALHVALDAVEAPRKVRVWNDVVAAYDMGDLAAQWFGDFLHEKLRLVRFDPEQRRLSNRRWTGEIEAENAFSDGYPILVIGSASLAELNRRLAAQGLAEVEMRRFRPNLVLEGLDAHAEDWVDELAIDVGSGRTVRLKLVKPCARCPIPNVDPATAETSPEPLATLSGYRADARVDGAITFGMNAVIVDGIDGVLRPGQAGSATVRF